MGKNGTEHRIYSQCIEGMLRCLLSFLMRIFSKHLTIRPVRQLVKWRYSIGFDWIGFLPRKDLNEEKRCHSHRVSSVQFSHSVVSDSLWPHESQHARPPCPSPTPGVYPNSGPLTWWCQPAISSSVIPFSSSPNPSQHQGLFQRVNSSHEVAKVLEFQLQHQSFQWTPRTDLLQDGLAVSPCSPRDSQESSPTPQFKSINFSVLSFLHGPTLTSIHDHWKNHGLD